MIRKKDISAALLGIVIALILWVTILGRDVQLGGKLFYPPFHTVATIWKEIQRTGLRSNLLGNIILFIPVGILFPMISGWKWKTVAMGTAFSLLIESIQLITRRGCFDPDDIILNCLGCIIGYGALCMARKLFTKNDLNAASN